MTDDEADSRNKAEAAAMAAAHEAERAAFSALIAKFANWNPGLRIDGSKLMLAVGDSRLPLGITTLGVLKGTKHE